MGSINFFTTYRPPLALDIFSLPADPNATREDEIHLTDGKSYNYNCQVIPPQALRTILRHSQLPSSSQPPKRSDIDSGRLTGLVFVSERDRNLETLHFALLRFNHDNDDDDDDDAYDDDYVDDPYVDYGGGGCDDDDNHHHYDDDDDDDQCDDDDDDSYDDADSYDDDDNCYYDDDDDDHSNYDNDDDDDDDDEEEEDDPCPTEVQVYSFVDVYGTFSGVRMEDSGCIAGGYKVGNGTADLYLVYASTMEPIEDRRQPWNAVYKTNLRTGETKRLTPEGTYIVSFL